MLVNQIVLEMNQVRLNESIHDKTEIIPIRIQEYFIHSLFEIADTENVGFLNKIGEVVTDDPSTLVPIG